MLGPTGKAWDRKPYPVPRGAGQELERGHTCQENTQLRSESEQPM